MQCDPREHQIRSERGCNKNIDEKLKHLKTQPTQEQKVFDRVWPITQQKYKGF